jgi:phospholipase/lecithinase/hemolysin
MTVIPLAFQRNQPTFQPINQLYVFGDSLSDVGNVFRATGGASPESPPYFQGHYSNGPIWVEQLVSQLKLPPQHVQNFAWGGATTGQTGFNSVPGILTQVDQFVKGHSSASAQALYVIWAGANDYLSSGATPTVSVGNLAQAIRSLSKQGAKRFLIGNLPDLGNLPATRRSEYSQMLSQSAIAHNQSLRTTLNQLQQELQIHFAELDSYAAYRDAIANPSKFGFKNVTNAYLDNQNGRLAQTMTASQPQADHYLFWDGIHPTTATHKILGNQAFSLVQTMFVSQAR